MLLNAFSILDLFLVFLRLVLSVLVVCFSMSSWRQIRSLRDREMRSTIENRGYLVYSLAVALLGLSLVSWPFFYLMLQSYVPELPGTMCIFGVTRIGAGSIGVSRFLPGLVQTLQATKPLIVFLAGNWFVFYLMNRRTSTAPLTSRVFVAAAIMGFVVLADAVAETVYVIIPKKEEFLSLGCCTGTFDVDSGILRSICQDWFSDGSTLPLGVAYFAINGGMAVLLFVLCTGWLRVTKFSLGSIVAGAIVSLPINILFLVEVAAPTILRLPFHHCPYDLLPNAPESMFGVALYGIGWCAIGWAALIRCFARCSETERFFDDFLRSILYLGLVGFFGSLTLMSTELLLAVS